MREAEPDRITRALATLASVAFFALLASGALVLVAALAVRGFGVSDPDWSWGLPVAVAAATEASPVATEWGLARLEVDHLSGSLRLPVSDLPWWLFALLWTQFALVVGLVLAALHHLRRVLQRARDGAPFDADNARRLLHIGWSLLGLAVVSGGTEAVTAWAVRQGAPAAGITVPAQLPLDLPLALVALALMALARVFRRGAELEHEQSLVI